MHFSWPKQALLPFDFSRSQPNFPYLSHHLLTVQAAYIALSFAFSLASCTPLKGGSSVPVQNQIKQS